MYIKTGVYTGDGTGARSIAGITFQPDFVVVASGAGDRAAWTNSSITAGYSHTWSSTFNNTGGISSLDSDGFTVRTGYNTNITSYIWLAIQKNSANDFAIGTFTGNGGTQSITISPAFQPTFVVGTTEVTASVNEVYTTPNLPAAKSQYFDGADTLADGITALNSNGFSVGAGAYINTNVQLSDYIAAKDTAGIFKTGTYTGDGTASRNITGLGFQPDFVIVKVNVNATQAVGWSSSDSANGYSFINLASITNGIKGSVSDGFTVGANVRTNNNLDTYYYMAWKSNPAPAKGANNLELLGVG